jgi:hypothetical protein
LDATSSEIDAYLRNYLDADLADFALKKHPFEVPTAQLAQQLNGLKKARKKFPKLFAQRGVSFPPQKNLEQTSSQITACYKAQMVKYNSVADITGGFGIDALALAGYFDKVNDAHDSGHVVKANTIPLNRKVYHVEQDKSLQQIARSNFKNLGVGIQSFCEDGINWVKDFRGHLDLNYLDPARRDEHHRKVVFLEDYQPDVTEHLDLLLQKARYVMIKASPLLDITAAVGSLKQVFQVDVVAVNNEVKELLFLCAPDTEIGQTIRINSINLESGQANFQHDLGINPGVAYSEPLQFLYEPNAAVMKSQAYNQISAELNLPKLAANTHLLTGQELKTFPGRVFEVLEWQEFNLKKVKKKYGGGRFGVITRNLNGIGILGSVKALRKHLSLGEHDTDYLIFAQLQDGKRVICHCRKI